MEDKTITLTKTQLAFLTTQLQWKMIETFQDTLKETTSFEDYAATLEATANHIAFTAMMLGVKIGPDKIEEMDSFSKEALLETLRLAEPMEGLF